MNLNNDYRQNKTSLGVISTALLPFLALSTILSSPHSHADTKPFKAKACAYSVKNNKLPRRVQQAIEEIASHEISNQRINRYLDVMFSKISKDDGHRKALKITNPFPLFRAASPIMLHDIEYIPRMKELYNRFYFDPKTGQPIISAISDDSHLLNYDWWVKYSGNSEATLQDLILSRNDYDETVSGNWQRDLSRKLTSLVIDGRVSNMPESIIQAAVIQSASEFLNTFRLFKNAKSSRSIKNLENKYSISGTNAGPFLQDSAKRVIKKKEIKSAQEKWTVVEHNQVLLRDDSDLPFEEQKLIRFDPASSAYQAIEESFVDYHKKFSKQYSQRHYKILSIGLRLNAGTGSLGRRRIAVLFEGYSGGRHVIVNLKLQGHPAYWGTMTLQEKALYFESYLDSETGRLNHAKRAYEGHKLLSLKSNAHSGWVRLGDSSDPSYYTVYEVSPYKEGIPVEKLVINPVADSGKKQSKKEKAFLELAQSLGRTTAIGQIRADRKARKKGTSPFFKPTRKRFIAPIVSSATKDRELEFMHTQLAISMGHAALTIRDYQAVIASKRFQDAKNYIPEGL